MRNGHRRAAMFGAATLVAGLLGLAWLAFSQFEAAPKTAASRQDTESRALARLFIAQLIAPPVNERAQPAPASGVVGATATPVWDLCGVGRMPVPTALAASADANAISLEHLPSPLGEHAMLAAAERLTATLTAGSHRQRAVAALLKFHEVKERTDVEDIARRLADLAAASNDHVVLSWALSMCASYIPGHCDEGLARRWVALEPDNAAAWLALGQVKGMSRVEVDRGLLHATRYSLHFGAAAETMQSAWPLDLPRYLKVVATVSGLGFDSMISSQPLATRHCGLTGKAGELESPACAALAQVMAEHSDSLMGRMIGIASGRRSGWGAARVDAARAESQALQMQAAAGFDFSSPQALSCREVDRLESYVQAVAASGEVAHLRQLSRQAR